MTGNARKQTPSAWRMIWPTLALLASACSTTSEPLPVPAVLVTRQAQLPALPASARQPEPTSECQPTCLQGLSRVLSDWQQQLTRDAQPD